MIPITLHGTKTKLAVQVIALNIPLLISKESMKEARAIINLESEEITLFGKTRRMETSEDGHIITRVKPNDEKGGDASKTQSQAMTSEQEEEKSDRKRSDGREETRIKGIKEMAEMDDRGEVRVKSSFTLWKGPLGHAAQIQAEMMVYNYGDGRNSMETSGTRANQLTNMKTEKINLNNDEGIEKHHTAQMRVESYATANTLTKTNDSNQLDGETCYILYRRMKEILGDIGFGEAVWPHKIPTNWQLIYREARKNGEVRWIQAGNRRYRIASQQITAGEGDHESEATKYTEGRRELENASARRRNDEERMIGRDRKKRSGDHTQEAKKWIEPGRARKEVI